MTFQTSMHSNRMHTARLFPVSPSLTCAKVGGCQLPGGGDGCLLPVGGEGCLLQGVSATGGVSAPRGISQHALRQTPAREQNDRQV